MTAAALIDTLENVVVFLFIGWLIYLWLKPDPDGGKPDDPAA
jgi:hypothetical protein